MPDICQNRHRGADTSVEAFESVKMTRVRVRRLIIKAISRSGDWGSTAFEVADRTGLLYQTVVARISELRATSTIKVIGKRPSPSGCPCRVYGF